MGRVSRNAHGSASRNVIQRPCNEPVAILTAQQVAPMGARGGPHAFAATERPEFQKMKIACWSAGITEVLPSDVSACLGLLLVRGTGQRAS